jgi:hypothetical protein
MNRLGLKISCLVVSVLIWFQVANNSDLEQTVNLPLEVTGLEEGLTTDGSQNLPKKVRVRLTGSKLNLLAHQYFNKNIGRVAVNLAGLPDTTLSYRLSRVDIQTKMFNPEIVGARNISVTTDLVVSRMLPVVLVTEKALPVGLDFVAQPHILPDSVPVEGPSRFFSSDMYLQTESIDLGRISENGVESVDLLSLGEFLRPTLSEVKVSFLVGRLEKRTLTNVPVVPLVDAGRPDVGISPPVADVTVEGLADSVRFLTRDRISVVVSTDTLDVGLHRRSGQVVCPDWVTSSEVVPSEFQVIVGNPPDLRQERPDPPEVEDQSE